MVHPVVDQALHENVRAALGGACLISGNNLLRHGLTNP